MTDTEAMSISQAGKEQEEAGQEASSAQLSKAQLKRLKKKAAAAQGGEDAANGAAANGTAANGAAGGGGGTAPEPAGAEAEDSGDEEEGAEGERGEAAAEGAAKKKKKKKCEWPVLDMLRGIGRIVPAACVLKLLSSISTCLTFQSLRFLQLRRRSLAAAAAAAQRPRSRRCHPPCPSSRWAHARGALALACKACRLVTIAAAAGQMLHWGISMCEALNVSTAVLPAALHQRHLPRGRVAVVQGGVSAAGTTPVLGGGNASGW